jgi:hypothetical protein
VISESKWPIVIGISILFFNLAFKAVNYPIKLSYFDKIIIITGILLILIGVANKKILKIFGKIDELCESKTYYILLTILFVSIVLRFIFISERWINPDEGAHLYDAK